MTGGWNGVFHSYTVDLGKLAAGQHMLTFRGLDSVGGDNTAFVDNVLMFNTLSATASTVSASRNMLPADSATTSTISVTLLDAAANPVSGKATGLAQNSGAHSTISAPSGVSDTSGVVTFSVLRRGRPRNGRYPGANSL